MREVKFRAWVDNERMIDHDWMKLSDWTYFDMVEDKLGILMQYTGLKDKEGVEIYESDLVKGLGLTGKILWIEEECCFMFQSKNGGAFINQEYLDNFEVIGNIYENKELLEQP